MALKRLIEAPTMRLTVAELAVACRVQNDDKLRHAVDRLVALGLADRVPAQIVANLDVIRRAQS